MSNDGGPAFPTEWLNPSDERNSLAPDGRVVPPNSSAQMYGMSLRDYFAAKAMQGMLADPDTRQFGKGKEQDFLERFPKSCYMIADAMLRAREAK